MKKYLSSFLFFLTSFASQAQDFMLSQFYSLPMSVNAAATGYMESGNQRISLAYRGNWDDLNTEGIYQGGLAAYEYRHCSKHNFWALGGLLQAEGTRFARFEQAQLRLSGAFHYNLGEGIYASVGGGGGALQYGAALGDLRYDRQFVTNVGYDPNLGSGESFPSDNLIRLDLNAGAQVYDAYRGWGAGIAFTHLNRPEFSFLGEQNFLGIGLAVHGTGTIWVKKAQRGRERPEGSALIIRGLYYRQSVSGSNSRQWQTLLGGFYKLKGKGDGTFLAGCMARFAGRTGRGAVIESLVPSLQMGGTARIGLSYDFNVQKLAVPSAGRLELTFGWTFGNEERCINCFDF